MCLNEKDSGMSGMSVVGTLHMRGQEGGNENIDDDICVRSLVIAHRHCYKTKPVFKRERCLLNI